MTAAEGPTHLYFASGACFGATLCCGTSKSPCFVSRSRSVVPSAEELVNEIVFSASGPENRSMGMHRLANNCLRINGRVNLRTGADLETGHSFGCRRIPDSLHLSGAFKVSIWQVTAYLLPSGSD